jgi:ArsR family transcriptional regulator
MSLTDIYQCLSDETRRRLLNLLHDGELCVCHFQEIMGVSQVKISKHLAYLRARGLVVAHKEANWVVYRLPENPSPEVAANLACLQDCVSANPVFRRDSEKRARLIVKFAECSPVCCGPKARKKSAGSS